MMSQVDIELIKSAQQGDTYASEKLVQDNSGLIWSIVRRYFGRGVDAEDLYQIGCIGFLKAISGFDAQYGTQFSTYAVPKISGEIRRFLRDDGSIKVSRSIKERAQAIRLATSDMEQKLGRAPTVGELAEKLNMTAEDIAAAQVATGGTESLQRETGEDGFTLENLLGDYDQEDRLVEHVALREAISALPKMEQMVLGLRYYRGMTQDSAAKILKVSQVQVSRLERKAVNALRQHLK